ncbi:hypothetical protein V8C42DRAFT_359833 [Trichoderma barbatum]
MEGASDKVKRYHDPRRYALDLRQREGEDELQQRKRIVTWVRKQAVFCRAEKGVPSVGHRINLPSGVIADVALFHAQSQTEESQIEYDVDDTFNRFECQEPAEDSLGAAWWRFASLFDETLPPFHESAETFPGTADFIEQGKIHGEHTLAAKALSDTKACKVFLQPGQAPTNSPLPHFWWRQWLKVDTFQRHYARRE